MGQVLSSLQLSKSPASLQSRVKFEQMVDDPRFGPIQIYRSTSPPYDYIMNHRKLFVDSGIEFQKLYQHIKAIQKLELLTLKHKVLAKVFFHSVKQESNLCVKNKAVDVYCSYYNYSLLRLIEIKRQAKAKFTEEQLIYIFGSLLDLAVWLKDKQGLIIGDYRPSNIFIAPEGSIKMYLLDVQKDHSHSNYYRTLVSINSPLTQWKYLAPEQISKLKELKFEIDYDVFKADLFAMGMVILETIIQDDAQCYYTCKNSQPQGSVEVNTQRIWFDLQTLRRLNSSCNSSRKSLRGQQPFQKGKNLPQYSRDFIQLLRMCLLEDPKKRFTLEEAHKFLQGIKEKYGYQITNLKLSLQNETEKAEHKNKTVDIRVSMKTTDQKLQRTSVKPNTASHAILPGAKAFTDTQQVLTSANDHQKFYLPITVSKSRYSYTGYETPKHTNQINGNSFFNENTRKNICIQPISRKDSEIFRVSRHSKEQFGQNVQSGVLAKHDSKAYR